MPRQPDQSELLALVEGELSATDEAKLRARLAHKPDLLVGLDRMIEDRRVLRSMSEPALPRDFLANLEPQLARPMLMEAQPGAYRRRHQQGRQRRDAVRLVMAAVLVLGGAGLGVMAWALWQRNGDANINQDQMVAADTPITVVSPGDGLLARNTAKVESAPGPGTIHHDGPGRGVRGRMTAAPEASPSRAVLASVGATDPILLPFDLHATVGDVASAEQQMVAAMTHLETPAAFLQNFSWAEARQIEKRWADAHNRAVAADPLALASIGGTGAAQRTTLFGKVARRVLEQVASNEKQLSSKQLAGPRELAPTFATQLEISSAGAGHTVALRLSDLAELLREIYASSEINATLQPRSGSETPPVWGVKLGSINASLDAIRLEHGDPIVLLPVRLESK